MHDTETLVHGVVTTHCFQLHRVCRPACWHLTLPTTTGGVPSCADDMATRWRISLEAHALALAALGEAPVTDDLMVMIPLVQPGKQRGWWVTGQPVEVVPNIAILATDRGRPGGPVLDYPAARTLAGQIAAAYLGEREGTTAYAVVTPDGDTFIHEDV